MIAVFLDFFLLYLIFFLYIFFLSFINRYEWIVKMVTRDGL